MLQDSLVEQDIFDSFFFHDRDDILTTVIERQERPGHVCDTCISWGLRDYFGPPPRRSVDFTIKRL